MFTVTWLCLLSLTGASVLQYVDPFVGSGGSAFGAASLPPGAQLPFSNARVSPDTEPADDIWLLFDHFGGYHYPDSKISVVSHTHGEGPGGAMYSVPPVMPWCGSMSSSVASDRYFFTQKFSHEEETATPGYYQVLLQPSGINMEITASLFSAIHRYSFPADQGDGNVIFPLHGVGIKTVAWQKLSISECVLTGELFQDGGFAGRIGGIHFHFVARFNTSCTGHGTYDHAPDNNGAWVSFAPGSTVEMTYSFSYIDGDTALLNAPPAGTTFDQLLATAQDIWLKELSPVQVQGGTEVEKTTFYSMLYRSVTAPSTFSEAKGRYRGFDNETHTMEANSTFYSDMSIWDVFRTQMPLLGLLKPTRLRDICRSLVLMYQQGGAMPRWPLAHGYTGAMDGQHADLILLHAIAVGITDFNIKVAYAGMRQGAVDFNQTKAARRDLKLYQELGYVPYESNAHGAVYTLEGAYDDWAVAQVANYLGLEADVQFFSNRSQNWRNVWNAEHRLFCPKTREGKWECPLLKTDVFDKRYVEGDAWHYRFYVPHAFEALIEVYGGAESMTKVLKEFFDLSFLDPVELLPNPYLWQGNEPSLLPNVLAFAHLNRTDLVQTYSRKVMEAVYSATPAGIPGNNDYGALSAWYVMAAFGLMANPGTNQYALGIPLFPTMQITLENGNTLTLVRSGDGVVSKSISVDGQPWTSSWISHQTLLKGPKIVFET